MKVVRKRIGWEQVGRFAGLVIVTLAAAAVATLVLVTGYGKTPSNGNGNEDQQQPADVSVMQLELEPIEITDEYSGMLRPWERFSLGFETAGRVLALGVVDAGERAGQPLDDGDRIAPQQILAQLDDELLQCRLKQATAQQSEANARLSEATAQLAQATSDMQRADQLRQRSHGAITDAQYQSNVTALKVAEARLELARAQLAGAKVAILTVQEDIEDTVLHSPVGGVISKRLVNAGESVSPHQIVMEIIQVDPPLLVVGIPEAYVGEIEPGQKAHVSLVAPDRFRRRRGETEGRVFRVAEAADQTTGLFEVEIALPKADHKLWKPGLIAQAEIVLREIDGFRIPLECTLVLTYEMALRDEILSQGEELLKRLSAGEDEVLFLYSVDQDDRARRLVLDSPIKQGGEVIVQGLSPQQRTIVRRGQHQLVEGGPVKVVGEDGSEKAENEAGDGPDKSE